MFLENLKDNFNTILDLNYLGFSFYQILIFFLAFISLFFLNTLIANFLLRKIKKIVLKTKVDIDDQLFYALVPSLKLFPIVVIFFLFSLNLDPSANITKYIFKINHSLITIFIFWFMFSLLTPFSVLFIHLEKTLSKAIVNWVTSGLKYLIIFLGVAALLETWGIKVGPIIAGLGLLGVAIALGAQDLFKNLISGILILIEKRFHIGDVINIPGHAEGTVEYIGFRSTLIRKFDSTPINLPNYIFAETPILNYSNRTNRRINWVIGLEYNSTLEQIKSFTETISDYIKSSSDFLVNDNYKSFVRLDKFNDSSVDILVYCFTTTNDWETFLTIKEKLALKIKQEVEKIGLGFAFPSRSVYIENFKKEDISKI